MTRRRGRLFVPVAPLAVSLAVFLAVPVASADRGEHRGQTVRVMTRNIYLGADLSPAIRAISLAVFIDANGAVLRQVAAANFPVRAKGLAAEILDNEPDLIGLQEVALWRAGPPSLAPLLGGSTSATTVRYDYLQLLLEELNTDHVRYQPVVVQTEFDYEAPADENGTGGDGPSPIVNAELNARLTMRDVILARVGHGVHTTAPTGGNFRQLLTLSILGRPVTVTRGWTSVDAKVRGGDQFRMINTHLEAFDPRTVHPSLRSLQAGELVAPGGPADSDLPVVLVGDLNSDDDTVAPDDQQAYRALLNAGLVERSTNTPLSCCQSSYDLTTGSVDEFDHQVDHIMTNAPTTVTLIDSTVTGREMRNGYWNSDHAGILSTLRIPRSSH
jgi:endonuclease/exonuclease/phosphatase family metal-dependent hydrolase